MGRWRSRWRWSHTLKWLGPINICFADLICVIIFSCVCTCWRDVEIMRFCNSYEWTKNKMDICWALIVNLMFHQSCIQLKPWCFLCWINQLFMYFWQHLLLRVWILLFPLNKQLHWVSPTLPLHNAAQSKDFSSLYALNDTACSSCIPFPDLLTFLQFSTVVSILAGHLLPLQTFCAIAHTPSYS